MAASVARRPRGDAISSEIRIDSLSKHFDGVAAVDAASFDVPAGAFAALLGPSGCGKSTLLRMIAGLETPSAGRIYIAGRDVSEDPPAARGVAMVFQNYALFPHLNVRDNILFGLSVRKAPRAEQERRLEHAVSLLGLGPYLARKPAQLSGGQQQRVALGRAIVAEAPVCLMDEPLSNLDAQLRAEMRREIRELQKRLGLTMVYVTHDQIEAMTMADRIVLMNGGRVEQCATPDGLYGRPQTVFAARFIGAPPMNLFPAADVADAPSFRSVAAGARDGLLLGVRPEDFEIGEGGAPATVRAVEYQGADSLVETTLARTPVIVRVQGKARIAVGDTIPLACHSNALHLFDRIEGRRLN